MKNVSVIIIHWNTPGELKRQMAKLKPSGMIEIIVVDNHSGKKIRVPKGITLIQNSSNRGFAAACNQGAAVAKGEWLFFLNPDTHISTTNVLTCIEKARKPGLDAGSLSPSSGDYQKPLPSALSLLVEFSPLRRFIPLSLFGTKTLFGGGLFIKRTVFKKIGGWDEHFFLWFEDSDITQRLLAGGYRIGWVKIPFAHKGGASFVNIPEKKRRRIFFTSMSQYAHKNFNAIGVKIFKFVNLLNNR